MLPHHAFFFLRHGETDWNLARKMMGLADIPLNATGRSQADAARLAALGLGLKSIVSSSLSRAWQTAEIVNRELGLALMPLDDLREVDVGPYQGVSDPDWMQRWHAGESMSGVESFAAFCERIRRGINRALMLDHPVLIVSHGGVFRAIEKMLGHRGNTDLPNAVLARFEPPAGRGAGWRIKLV